MLLYLVKFCWRGMCCGEGAVELSGDVALERPHDLLGGAAFSASPCDIGPGCGVGAHADDHHRGQRTVQAAVPTAVESVSHSVSRGGRDRTSSCQRGERRFGAHPARVRPRHEHAGSHDGANAGKLAQLRGDVRDGGIECLAVVGQFCREATMRLANRMASWRQVAITVSSRRSRHPAMTLNMRCGSAFRASTPRSTVRSRAVSALIARVRSATISSRATLNTRSTTLWPVARGHRSPEVSTPSTERAMRTASNASVLPTPRRSAAGIADGSATSNPAAAARWARPAP